MNIKKTKFLLIPRSKPKSWVLMNCALLTFIFVALPIVALGGHFHLGFIRGLGWFLVGICFITSFCMSAIQFVKTFTGKYGKHGCVEERDWKDQIW